MKVLGLFVLLILTVFMVMTLSCGCVYAASASAGYERLESLFLQGQYAAVVNESDAVAKSGYGRKDEVYYLKGLSQLKTKRFADARESFGYIDSNLPYSKRVFDARLGTGDSYILEGDLNAGAGVYNRMINEFPSNKNLPEVYARLASCYSGLGLRDKAATYDAMARKASPYSFGMKIQAQPSGQQSGQAAGYASGQTLVQNANVPSPMNVFSVQVPGGQTGGTALSVQAGSFKSRENASKFAQELASRGYESRVEVPVGQQVPDGQARGTAPSAQEKLYRVKVGRPTSKLEAEAIAERLQRDGYMTAICSNDL